MKQIDARGLLCPMPVLKVQNEVKASHPEQLEVLVDDKCAVENVTRFASSQKYSVSVAENDGEFTLTLKK